METIHCFKKRGICRLRFLFLSTVRTHCAALFSIKNCLQTCLYCFQLTCWFRKSTNAHTLLTRPEQVQRGSYIGGEESVTECKLLSRLMPRYVELHENLVVVSIHWDTRPKFFSEVQCSLDLPVAMKRCYKSREGTKLRSTFQINPDLVVSV